MSARSTGTFSLMHRYCCFTREPQVCSRLKLTPPALSVAEYSFTGIDTSPKLRDNEAIERAAMRHLREKQGETRLAGFAGTRKLEAQRLHRLRQRLATLCIVRPRIIAAERQVFARGRD